jgi:hypothetical protein
VPLRKLKILVHSDPKTGKTWFAETAPAPRLVLDAEGGIDFTDTTKIYWDPLMYAPPIYDGSWTTCVVVCRDVQVIDSVFNWLNIGEHPFRSFAMDSLTEIQKRIVDKLVGTSALQQQDWGSLLREGEGLVRRFRDLTMHPTHPIEVITLLCLTSQRNDGKLVPQVQGSLRTSLPGYPDVIGYLQPMQNAEGQLVRRLWVQPWGPFIAGDRTNKLGDYVDDPTIPMLLDLIYGPELVAAV